MKSQENFYYHSSKIIITKKKRNDKTCVIKLHAKLLIVKYLRIAPSRPPKLIKKPDNVTNN